MNQNKKMSSKERQYMIINALKESTIPIAGRQFAEQANVSRQVIVQDVSILKAKGEPIIATSQGYIYQRSSKFKHIIAVKHSPEQVREELNIIVDHGVTVRDVIIEHAVYGDLTASIMVSNRKEVECFIKKIEENQAAYLATLTDGIHLHTLEADSMDKIKDACQALQEANILID